MYKWSFFVYCMIIISAATTQATSLRMVISKTSTHATVNDENIAGTLSMKLKTGNQPATVTESIDTDRSSNHSVILTWDIDNESTQLHYDGNDYIVHLNQTIGKNDKTISDIGALKINGHMTHRKGKPIPIRSSLKYNAPHTLLHKDFEATLTLLKTERIG